MVAEAKWLADLRRLLPVRSGFVIQGSHKGLSIDVKASPLQPASNEMLLQALLRDSGFDFLIRFDVASGVSLERLDGNAEGLDELARSMEMGGNLQEGWSAPLTPLVFAQRLLALERQRRDNRFKYGVSIEYGSRMADATQALAILLKRCDQSQPVLVRELTALHCPMVYWVDLHGDVPPWLSAHSQRVEPLTIAPPDPDQRHAATVFYVQRRIRTSDTSAPDW